MTNGTAYKSLLAAFLLLAGLLVTPCTVSATPIIAKVRSGETILQVLGTGDGVDNGGSRSRIGDGAGGPWVSPDGFWSFMLLVTETDGAFNDKVSISGNVTHLKSPTGHNDGVGQVISWASGALRVNADDEMNGSVSATLNTSKSHGPHTDTVDGTLNATVRSFLNADSITSYEFVIEARHCSTGVGVNAVSFLAFVEDVCPDESLLGPETNLSIERIPEIEAVPEPGSLWLLGFGLAGTAGLLKRSGFSNCSVRNS